ncbi:Akirin [Trichoplax sp. H2]|nr:Akirin [Trichoplax sp. H2]|eukprot:RDD37794.1 Akirin [Trichoplax sp. H2]
MACATLKRRLDFDPLPGHSNSSGSHHHPSKRRRYLSISPQSAPATPAQPSKVFLPLSHSVDTDELRQNVQLEYKRILKRRRILNFDENDHDSGPISLPTSATDECHSLIAHGKKDMPLFTFTEVIAFCQKMLKQRENDLREEYDKVLTTKLAAIMLCNIMEETGCSSRRGRFAPFFLKSS